jgi:Ca2+-binding RTX toxin-like protein
MAVETTWSFEQFRAVATFGGRTNASIADLEGGGYAVSLEGPTSTLVFMFNDKDETTGSAVINGATHAQLEQRDDGAVAVAYRKDGALFEQALSTTGSVVQGETELVDPDTTPEAASPCATAFSEEVDVGTHIDSDVGFVYETDEGLRPFVYVSNSRSDHDTNADVACLRFGGYAVVWTRSTFGGSEMQYMYAVYNEDGTQRTLPAPIGSPVDVDFDREARVEARSDGGFTVVLTNPAADGGTDLQHISFDSSGNEFSNIPTHLPYAAGGTSTSVVDSEGAGGSSSAPAALGSGGLVVLPTDTVAMAFTSDQSGGADLDVEFDLVDLVTGESLLGGPLVVSTGVAIDAETDVAVLGSQGVAIAYETEDGVVLVTADLVATTIGGGAANTITGGDQIDIVSAQGGNDSVAGGAGNDRIKLGAGDDTGDGGTGVDTLDYSGANAVIIDLDLTGAQDTGLNGFDTIVGFENVIGSNGNDQIRGDELVNVLVGGRGDDLLRGLAANDRLEGGAGNDELFGGTSDDLLLGGHGDDNIDGNIHGGGGDTASYADMRTAVTIDLTIVTSQDTGGGGFDRLFEIEHLIGTRRGDTLTGNGVSNRLFGGDGGDTLNGGVGIDSLFGEAGNDTLVGGASNDPNNDFLRGGLGRDTLRGGAGGDHFVYGSFAECGLGADADRIMDFISPGGDKIDLSAVFAGTLSFIDAAAFGGIAGQVRLEARAAYQLVQIDINGDAVSDGDLRIMNSGVTDATSFIL